MSRRHASHPRPTVAISRIFLIDSVEFAANTKTDRGWDMGLRRQMTGLAFMLLLGGCSSSNISQFASGQPSMSPDKWMFGTVDGYGLIADRFGSVKSQFHAHEVGDWNAATQTMTVTEHI